jgi:hypothetical protein
MKKAHRTTSALSRRLLLEGLENRYALSGMVSAVIEDGNLVIEGDASNNQVVVYQGALAGQVVVSGGQEDSLDPLTETQINGSATAVTLSGFTGDVLVNLKGGDDQFIMTDINLPGMVNVNLGAGNDTFALQSRAVGSLTFNQNAGVALTYGSVNASQSVNVNASSGDDTIGLYDATVTDDVTVYAGDGDDTFVQDGTSLGANVIGGQLLLNMATGDDSVVASRLNVGRATITDPIATTGTSVSLNNVHAVRDVEMFLSVNDDNVSVTGEDTGANAFTAANVAIHTGNGDDSITVDMANVGNLSLFSGEGNEGGGFYGVQLTNLNVTNDLTVDTAGGLDNVLLQAVAASTINVRTGNDSDGLIVQNATATDAVFDTDIEGDVVGLYDSAFDDLAISLAAGVDQLYLSNVTANVSATIDGGDDSDDLFDLGGLSLNGLTRVSI